MTDFWNQKSFVLITGASRGLGQSIAIEFSQKVGPGSVFLLLARSSGGLQETKSAVLALAPNVEVLTSDQDLGKPEAAALFDLISSSAAKNGSSSDFDHAILVHNAGCIPEISKKIMEYTDLDFINNYFQFNLLSVILLTSQFLRVFNDPTKQRSVVQISSSAALGPAPTLGLYCTGKVARDMLMRNIAAEDPSISTISYDPGPFESFLYEQARTITADETTRKLINDIRDQGKLLTAEFATKKLVRLLAQKKFRKGEHVDVSEAVV